jgi:hypothetical protein
MAQPIERGKVPEELEPWIEWVLEGRPSHVCPVVNGGALCLWPGKLVLALDETGGRFEQAVFADRELTVALPGSTEHWPTAVRVDGREAVVLGGEGGRPGVRLGAGEHRVQGRFAWPALPEVVQIPASTATVALTVGGRPVQFPKRDEGGKLWVKRSGAGEGQGEQLELEVHRKIADGVPLMVTTRILLRAGGRAREVNLGDVLLEGTVPMKVWADVPVRLEPGGDLLVQARAGNYTVEVVARTEGEPEALGMKAREAPWPAREIWVWAADESLRQVSIKGAQSVDPARTNLDTAWKELPAFRLGAGERMVFATTRRGEPEPPPNHLVLDRELWLDLDGRGYTVRDRISGTMRRGWRLDLEAGKLGHVAAGGEDQLITVAPDSGKPGVELRQSALDLTAEWRADQSLQTLPAVGWSEDVQSLSATLNLPPGWSLFAVDGVDKVTTWISRWDLLGFFFVLLVALATGKLVGVAWGALALLTLVVCHHESDAPFLVWLSLLLFMALLKVLPAGKVRTVMQVGWVASLVALLLIGLPFAVQQIRTAIYPQIAEEHGGLPSFIALPGTASRGEPGIVGNLKMDVAEFDAEQELAEGFAEEAEVVDMPQAASPEPLAQQAIRKEKKAEVRKMKMPLRTRAGGGSGVDDLLQAGPGWGKGDYVSRKRQVALRQDPNAIVQTGPGVPNWSWKKVRLSWSGPVAHDHEIRLWLLSPPVNCLLSFLRVVLMALLAFALVRAVPGGPRAFSGRTGEGGKKGAAKGAAAAAAATAAVAALAGILLAPAPASAEIPGNDLLRDLENRLTRPAPCRPGCVSVELLEIEFDRSSLRMAARVHVGAPSSFRVPGPAEAWVPSEVRVNGKPHSALALLADGFLHARLPEGLHRVEVRGPLPPSDSLTLTLGDAPHRVTVSGDGWNVDGLREDGRAEESIQLSRMLDASDPRQLDGAALPPFLEITRELSIGINWKIYTTVRRVSPTGSPVVARFPLLKNESVTESQLLVEDDELVLTLGRDQQELSFSSTLEQGGEISLTAAENKPWSEVWVVNCGPVWHCRAEGPAPVEHLRHGSWQPRFRPWPGQSVKVGLVKPRASKGQSTTIDSASLEVSPGIRILKANLRLSIRSSTGGVHEIALPGGARVQQLLLDNKPTPIRQKGEKLRVTLKPGARRVFVSWQQPGGIAPWQGVPPVGLGGKAANARVVLNLPSDRWLLWAGGPSWGPAILFWGYLILILMVAAVLPRLPGNSLRPWQWILLGLGITQIPAPAALVVVGWFFAMGFRARYPQSRPLLHDLMQLCLLGWTVAAMFCLYMAVHQGLLVQPDMEVMGAGSSDTRLVWYLDRVDGRMHTPYILSVSIWAWRFAMLLWSLWLAASLVKWLPWAWRCFSAGGAWKRIRPERSPAAAPAYPPPVVPPPVAPGPPPVVPPPGTPGPPPVVPAAPDDSSPDDGES